MPAETPTARRSNDAMAVMLADHLARRTQAMTTEQITRELFPGEAPHRTTIFRWLKQAEENGLVQAVGAGRNTRWTASREARQKALQAHFALPAEQRPVVGYNEEFLHEYEPNRTFYLSERDRERLHLQCPPGSAAFHELSDHDQSLFLCGLSYASSSLEGNRYDMASTERLLLEGLAKEGATQEETIMVQNHHEAVRYLIEHIHYPERRNDLHSTARDLKTVHALLSQHLLRSNEMCGTLRRAPVKIKHSPYVPPHIPELIEREFLAIASKARQIKDPYEQAFFLLVHLPYLQPFEDCNKRTARVACNIPLLKAGVVPMSWLDINDREYIDGILAVYERNDPSLLATVFYNGYLRSSERFNVMRQALQPNPTVVKYRGPLKRTVRSVVLGGDLDWEGDVDPVDRTAFCAFVEQELDQLQRKNAAAMLRYSLQEGDLEAWLGREDTRTIREVMREAG